MATPPTPGRPRLRRRWLWFVGVPLLGLVGYFMIAPLVQAAVLRVQLAGETASARASALPEADAAHAQWLPKVSGALGLTSAPVYSATYDVCWTDHTDGGWIPQNYNRNCHLAYVDFYTLPKQNDAVDAAIADAGTEYGTQTSGFVLMNDYLEGAGLGKENLPEDMPLEIWATLPGTSDARAATDSWTVAFDGVVAYAQTEAYDGRELLTESGRTALDPAQGYLVVADARSYYSRDIGCAIGRPVFCSSPLGGD